MKKITMLLMFVLASIIGFSQTVQVGSGSSTSSNFPIVSCYGYTYSQQIYLASEIGMAGNIEKVKFYYASGGSPFSNSDNWNLYLGHTTKSAFASNTDWEPVSGLTNLFSGTIVPIGNSWFEMTLTTPFAYNGTDNLLIAVDENVTSWNCTMNFGSYTAAGNQGIYYRSDGTNPDPATPPSATGTSSSIAQVQLVFPSSLPPACSANLMPADLATGVAMNPTLTWDADPGATSYDVYLSTTTPATLVGNVPTPTYTPATALSPSTLYYYNIVPQNAIGGATGCVEQSFTTGTGFNYCASTYSSGGSNDGITNVTLGLLSNTTAGNSSSPYYTFFSAATVPDIQQSTTADVSISFGSDGNQYSAVWIDFNQDGVFDASEGMIASGNAGGGGTTTISIPVPPGAVLGNTRMRVRGGNDSPLTTAQACGASSSNFGETEDYTVNITLAPPCPSPISVVATLVDPTSASVAWMEVGSATSWTIEYGAPGYTPGTGTTVAAATNPFTVTGIPCGAAYDFYVTSDCGVDGTATSVAASNLDMGTCPCSGAPAPGATISSVGGVVCSGNAFDLTLTTVSPLSGQTYQWESASDMAFTSPVILSSTGPTQNIASQGPATYYRCLVTCSSGPASTYSTPVFVDSSTYCPCTPTYSNGIQFGDLLSDVSISGTTLANNTGTSTSPNISYTYFTGAPNLTADLQAGSSYNVTVTVGSFGSQNVAAWIDYNDDAVFDASEKIGFTTSSIGSGGTATFTILLACNPPLGTHRMRIRDVYNQAGSTIDPCNNYSYGETEDYDVTILAAVACPAPTSLVASNPTATTMDLAWNIGCAETAWNVIYGPTGFDPLLSGTSVAVTSNPATISGLTCELGYDFYVQADCGATDGVSLISTVASGTTGLCPCTGTPAPGNAEASLATVCSGSSVNLSLQNAVVGGGVTYQWESADDAAFTINVQSLGTNDTETGTINGDTYFRCVVSCAASGLTTNSNEVLVMATPLEVGNDMATAKMAMGPYLCSDSAWVDTVNTSVGCWSSVYSGSDAQSSADAWYTFTLTESTDMLISLCESGFDTYLHLLDGAGNNITSNDDNGPACSGNRSSIDGVLAAGTYYVVAQGFSSNTGEIVMRISKNETCNACSFAMVLDNTVTTTSTTADVTWNTSTYSGTGWYVLEYKEATSSTWLNGGTASTSAVHKFFTGLTPSTTYDVRGRTVCTPGNSSGPWSATVQFTTPILQGCALSPVLAASTVQGNFIEVTWPAVTGAGWYAIRYKESTATGWTSGGTTSGTSKTISGLTAGTSYDFEALTYCTNGVPSLWGGLVTVSTTALAGCELPPALDALPVATSMSAITFSWSPITGAGWYGFQYKVSGSTTWINGGTAGSAATMKTKTGLLPGTSYDFQARTFCPNGAVSGWSGTESYMTMAGPVLVANNNPGKPTPDLEDKSLSDAGEGTKVYPNPTSDVVNVEINFENASENTTLRLMDMSGRVVRLIETQSNAGVNTITIDLQDLTNGIYTLLVYDNNSLIHTSKVKKN